MIWIAYLALVIFGLLMAWKVPQLRYYAKFLTFAGIISIGSVFYAIYFSFIGPCYENAWRFKRVFWLAGRIIGLKAIVKDPHYLTADKPCIYVANHQSCIDVFSLCDVWPKRCTIVSKSSIKFAGPMGLITWFAKLIFIDRSKHNDAISAMQKAAEEASKHEVSVFLFPEGTRGDKDTLLPFKKGAFHFAIKCQFPIQPIVISSYNRFLDHKNRIFDNGTYYVQILPQISTAGMTSADVDRLLEETYKKMLKAFDELKTLPVPS